MKRLVRDCKAEEEAMKQYRKELDSALQGKGRCPYPMLNTSIYRHKEQPKRLWIDWKYVWW